MGKINCSACGAHGAEKHRTGCKAAKVAAEFIYPCPDISEWTYNGKPIELPAKPPAPIIEGNTIRFPPGSFVENAIYRFEVVFTADGNSVIEPLGWQLFEEEGRDSGYCINGNAKAPQP